MCYEKIYAHSDTGTPLFGNVTNLIRAIRGGAAIRVHLRPTDTADSDPESALDLPLVVVLSGNQVAGQSTQVFQVNSWVPLTAAAAPATTTRAVNTLGEVLDVGLGHRRRAQITWYALCGKQIIG